MQVPAAIAATQWAWVSPSMADSTVNLRSGPGTEFSIQLSSPLGTRLIVLGSQRQPLGNRDLWYQVRSPKNEQEKVWIRSDFLSFTAPFQAQPQQSCEGAIAQTKERLGAVPKNQLLKQTTGNHGYLDGPPQRPKSFALILQGSGAANVLASPVFMNQLASNLMENCLTLGLVSYSIGETDSGYLNYGLMPGRLVRPFQCKTGPDFDHGPSNWGQQICL